MGKHCGLVQTVTFNVHQQLPAQTKQPRAAFNVRKVFAKEKCWCHLLTTALPAQEQCLGVARRGHFRSARGLGALVLRYGREEIKSGRKRRWRARGVHLQRHRSVEASQATNRTAIAHCGLDVSVSQAT